MNINKALVNSDVCDLVSSLVDEADQFCIRSGFGNNHSDIFQSVSSAGPEILLKADSNKTYNPIF